MKSIHDVVLSSKIDALQTLVTRVADSTFGSLDYFIVIYAFEEAEYTIVFCYGCEWFILHNEVFTV